MLYMHVYYLCFSLPFILAVLVFLSKFLDEWDNPCYNTENSKYSRVVKWLMLCCLICTCLFVLFFSISGLVKISKHQFTYSSSFLTISMLISFLTLSIIVGFFVSSFFFKFVRITVLCPSNTKLKFFVSFFTVITFISLFYFVSLVGLCSNYIVTNADCRNIKLDVLETEKFSMSNNKACENPLDNNIKSLGLMYDSDIDVVLKYLKCDDVVLEYGSGGSTQIFSKYVNRYYSIDHNFDYSLKVWENVVALGLDDRTKMIIVPPKRFCFFESGYDQCNIPNGVFECYSQAFLHFEDKKFDKVIIDGRDRSRCSLEIMPFTHSDSLIFFHDFFQRKCYHVVLETFDIIDRGKNMAVLRKKKWARDEFQ